MGSISPNFVVALIGLVLACLTTITTVIIYIVNMKGDNRVQAKDIEIFEQELKNQKELHTIQLEAQKVYTKHLTDEGITLKNEQKQFGTSITRLEANTKEIFGVLNEIKSKLIKAA